MLLGIEIAALAHTLKLDLPFHLDVVGFCDEEGTRFATTLIGSKALANEFDPQWLNIEDTNGITMRQAMLDFGLNPNDYAQKLHLIKRVTRLLGNPHRARPRA
ncbi:hypothetical protein ACOBV9_18980 (plasmid) [Pseudoalteromonas espejiana]